MKTKILTKSNCFVGASYNYDVLILYTDGIIIYSGDNSISTFIKYVYAI